MATRPKLLSLALSLGLALLCGACASTTLAESWVDPSLKTLPRFQKVFVAYVGSDTTAQHHAEDALAAKLSAPVVEKCYALFPDAQKQLTPERAKDELRARGFDAAIVMRLARVEQQVTTTGTQPAYYRSFGRYYAYSDAGPYGLRTEDTVHVVTNVYSLADDKLLYSARSETFAPGSTAGMIDEIAAAIAEDLKQRGLHE